MEETWGGKLATLWFIWTTALISLAIYLGVCLQFGDAIQEQTTGDIPIELLRNVFFGVSCLEIILLVIIRRVMLPRPNLDSGPMPSVSGSIPIPTSLVGKYTTAMVVSLALAESIGIYGLILYLAGDTIETLYLFIGVSAGVMFFIRPKRTTLVAMALAAKNDTVGV